MTRGTVIALLPDMTLGDRRMTLGILAPLIALAGCSFGGVVVDGEPAGADPGGGDQQPDAAPTGPRQIELNLLFVHGVSSGDSRAWADGALGAVEAHVTAALAPRIADFEAANPGTLVELKSRRVNLYTDLAGTVLSPSIDAPTDGTGAPVAARWRDQLVAKLGQAYPAGERNIILIGHSTGGRVSVEVAANVGGDNLPGSADRGVDDRIAGVITLNGMIQNLENDQFDFVGPTGFITGCQLGQEAGWCDYAGLISAAPAMDSLAAAGRALVLISAGSCSPSLWAGDNDKALPLAAEHSPATPGTFYGEFCHSDTTDGGSPQHALAVSAAGNHMVDWLADRLPTLPAR